MTTARDIEQQLLALVEGSIEDTRVPDAIAAHADKRAGKPVTKTDADQLEAQLGIPVRLRRDYGMTSIAWAAGAGQNPWSTERSILIAHADTNVRWPTGDELRKKEFAYFSARDERNAQRRYLLQDHKAPISGQSSHSAVARAAAAVAKIREARVELDKLIAHEEPLYVMRVDVEKLVKAE